MSRDYNLLFGVLCVQLGKVTSDQLVQEAAAWATSPDTPLPKRLVKAKLLTSEDHDLIERLVKEAISAHGGDATKTLTAFGGEQQLQASFHDAITTPVDLKGRPTKPDTSNILTGDHQYNPGMAEIPGRYSLESEQARGGMGRIVLVHDDHFGRHVALKELLPQALGISDNHEVKQETPTNSPGAIRFLEEARITAQLEHPSIVPIYEQGRRTDGTMYYTMKFVQGHTLKKAIMEANTLDDRIGLLPRYLHICQAMAYSHSRGIIHRDIKPDNIMLGQFDETVLLDWGLAKSISDDEQVVERPPEATPNPDSKISSKANTEYGTIIGTPSYMAPEQAKGEVDIIDGRIDVFALGIVLFEILTGDSPYQTESDQETFEQLCSSDPMPDVRIGDPSVPPELVDICKRALEKDVTERYQTVLELAEDLEKFHNILQADAALRASNRKLTETNRELVESRDRERIARAQAETARHEADTSRQETALALIDAEKTLYHASIQLAANRLSENRLDLTQKALQEAPEILRNWEWGYLNTQTHHRFSVQADHAPQGEDPSTNSNEVWDDAFGYEELNQDAHESYVSGITFDTDSEHILTASADGTAAVWNVGSGQRVIRFSDTADYIQSARFSPDAKLVVTSKTYHKRAIIWNTVTGKKITELVGHGEPVCEARFSPNGKFVVTASEDLTARIWDVETSDMVTTLKGHKNAVTDAHFSDDGSELCTISLDGTSRVWNRKTGAMTSESICPEANDIVWAQINADQNLAAVSYLDGHSIVWDISKGNVISTQMGRSKKKDFAAFSPDGTALVAPKATGGAAIWDIETGKELSQVGDENKLLLSVGFEPEGKRIAAGAIDGSIHIWTPRPKSSVKETGMLEGHEDIVYYGSFSPDSKRVVTGSYDKTARVWDIKSGECIAVLEGHPSELSFAEYSENGYTIATGSWDLTRVLWDADTFEQIVRIDGRPTERKASFFGGPRSEYNMTFAAILGKQISPDGSYFLTRDNGVNHEIWDLPSGDLRCTLKGHEETLTTQAFSNDSSRVLTASMSGEAIIWDASTGENRCTLSKHKGGITTAAFNVDASVVVTSSLDRTAIVWNGTTGERIATLKGHGGLVKTACFSCDGEQILTTSVDGSVMLWDAGTGTRTAVLSGHRGGMLNGIFSPDSRRILTSDPEMGKIWGMDGREYVTLPSPSPLTHASWSPNGRYILTCSRDGSARIWDSNIS